jgi:GMP synthase (glutamine-hydrolysing)
MTAALLSHAGPGVGPATIAVVDFGGQYAHLIAKEIRAQGVFSRIVAPDAFLPSRWPGLKGVVLSGGPESVAGGQRPGLSFDPLGLDVPVLGICFGHQLLAVLAGGQVRSGGAREYGRTVIRVDPDCPLFRGLERMQTVWMSHGDHVDALPMGFEARAASEALDIAAFEGRGRRVEHGVFGLQFHPEVHHTTNGARILSNFLDLCVSERSWDPVSQEKQVVERIRAEAGDARLFLLVSGGVDSMVALALCTRAVGPERVSGIHIDTGFMRRDESAQVMATLRGLGVEGIAFLDAKTRFLEALRGVVEPEEKRRIMGRLFVDLVRERMPSLDGAEAAGWRLVQGTIYPDTVESGAAGKGAATIKTHHNRVEEIVRWIEEGRVIEPLVDLYKHEVRALGTRLGLPREIVERQPFPGPGLAVRILASDGASDGEGPDRACVPGEVLGLRGWKASLLPVRSVGVQGDSRTYGRPVALHEGPGTLDWEALARIVPRVPNALPEVNRVIVHLGGALPRDLKLTRLGFEAPVVALLQEADAVAHALTRHHREIWQMPVVLLPLADAAGRLALVLRPVRSRDAMTADVFPMPESDLRALSASLLGLEGIGSVFYDVTSKPPGTIEWE